MFIGRVNIAMKIPRDVVVHSQIEMKEDEKEGSGMYSMEIEMKRCIIPQDACYHVISTPNVIVSAAVRQLATERRSESYKMQMKKRARRSRKHRTRG